jgi:hypothetical protein
MRWCVSIGAMLVAGAIAWAANAVEPSPGSQLADTKDHVSVDIELVIAVDVSYSMDLDELAVQRCQDGMGSESPEPLGGRLGAPAQRRHHV